MLHAARILRYDEVYSVKQKLAFRSSDDDSPLLRHEQKAKDELSDVFVLLSCIGRKLNLDKTEKTFFDDFVKSMILKMSVPVAPVVNSCFLSVIAGSTFLVGYWILSCQMERYKSQPSMIWILILMIAFGLSLYLYDASIVPQQVQVSVNSIIRSNRTIQRRTTRTRRSTNPRKLFYTLSESIDDVFMII